MKIKQLIVDGSNIATEGRSLPSLKQLDEAVRAFLDDNEVDNVAVIVDATFGHRIDKEEVAEFDTAIANNEITTPPAGVIGRGDAFILQVADKAGAVVLSNDSFQEFHPQYRWLFDDGRLIGGKPVPGIGWVFTPRVPVRGPVSRRAMKAASTKKASALTSKKAGRRAESGKKSGGGRQAEKGRTKRPEKAAKGGRSVAEPAKDRGRKRAAAAGSQPLNEPLAFIQFVSDHHVAETVTGLVESFSSHGAYVRVGAALCYVPLKAMGDPAPRRARDVLTIGEQREFIVDAIDTPRRGIDLSLSALDAPRAEHEARNASTVRGARVANNDSSLVDEFEGGFAKRRTEAGRKARSRITKANTDAPQAVTKDGADHHAEEAPVAPVKKAAKKTARKAAKRSPAKKAVRKTAKKAAKRPAKKAAKKTARKRPAKKAAKKRPAKKAAKRTTKKAAKRPAKKAAKKRPAKKAARKRPAKKAAKRRPAKKAAKRRR